MRLREILPTGKDSRCLELRLTAETDQEEALLAMLSNVILNCECAMTQPVNELYSFLRERMTFPARF